MASISAVAKIPPQFVLPALTLAVGLWFLIFGVLGLGFIFDLIPVFFCIALVTAFSIILLTLQLPIFLGLLAVPQNFMAIIPATIANLSNTSGRTVAISISALLLLAVLRVLYRKWGTEATPRGKLSQLGVASAGLLIVIVFTGVSSVLLGSLPLQQQLAPFISPLSMTPEAPAVAATVPSQATSGNSTLQTGIPSQVSLGNSSRVLGNSTTGPTSSLALVDPVLRRVAIITERQPLSSEAQAPAGVAVGNLSAANAATTNRTDPAPKLPFWSAFPEFNTTIPQSSSINLQLVRGLFFPSLWLFLAINVEHLAVARFFAHEQGYTISKSQEMFSLGVINLVNSLFGGVPVGGGDMTRSSILGFAGARSPLNQIFASITVLVAMMPASGALRFLPQAALASITFMAVFDQMPPQALMNVYFKLSFADFLAFFIVLNVGIAAPSGINGLTAIGLGVAYMILYTVFRGMFAAPKIIRSLDLESLHRQDLGKYLVEENAIPASTLIVKSDVDLVWTNAERMHRHIMNSAFLYNSGIATEQLGQPEPAWNMRIHNHIRSLRKQHENRKARTAIAFRPRLRMVILDFSEVAFLDTSALMNLDLAKKQLRYWAGDELEFRFVGLNKHLMRRFKRAKWPLLDTTSPEGIVEDSREESVLEDLVFESLTQALQHKSQYVGLDSTFEKIIEDGMDIRKKHAA